MLYDSTGGASWTTPWNLNQSMDTWSGITLTNGRVEQVVLTSKNLVGTIPDLNLQACIVFSLYANSGVTGGIPNFSNLSSLVNLDLRYCSLLGAIPNFSNMPNIEVLDLYGNNLSGTIPDFGSCNNLIAIYIFDNNLSGSIPDFNLPNLYDLQVYDNNLSGSIPTFTNAPLLRKLYLHKNNLNGSIPTFTNLSALQELFVMENNLSGIIPDLSQLPSFAQMGISKNMFSFDDFLPNFDSLNTNLTYFGYSPQDSIGTAATVNQAIGSNYTIDLVVDDTVTSNVYKWYKGGVLHTTINGNNELSFTNLQAADAGIYTCEVTNPNIPNLTLNSRPIMINVGATGVEKVQGATLVVAPNPVQDILTVQSNTTEVATIQIINTAGQILKVWEGQGQLGYTLDISSYPAGMYIVELTTAQQKLTKKIIKQ
ncbi:MAG: T9SS type A sorting domain-containing protein [Aureispira sp.]|nr:T9SS type A sorting domain-containing protein [Aureispira sp.]